jgi:hypothetical protein
LKAISEWRAIGEGLELDDPGFAMSPDAARESRLESGSASVYVRLDSHLIDFVAGSGPDLERLAGDRDRRYPLVRLEPIGMAEPEGTVADHSPMAIGAVTAPSSSASVKNIACDHNSGVATGPHRSIQACRAAGARR